MDELEQVWPEMIRQAIDGARASGRHDVAEYLTLKAANDAIRQTAADWLTAAAIELAFEAERTHSGLSVEREEPHSFQVRGSNMSGSLLRLRRGVRCLTLEVGWARTPKDGIMRGGALAYSRLTHFGMPKENAEVVLIRDAAGTPNWFADRAGERRIFDIAGLRRHIEIFIGE